MVGLHIADVAKRICWFQKSHRNDGVFIFIQNNKKGPIKSIKFCWRRAGSMTDLKVSGKLWVAYN